MEACESETLLGLVSASPPGPAPSHSEPVSATSACLTPSKKNTSTSTNTDEPGTRYRRGRCACRSQCSTHVRVTAEDKQVANFAESLKMEAASLFLTRTVSLEETLQRQLQVSMELSPKHKQTWVLRTLQRPSTMTR